MFAVLGKIVRWIVRGAEVLSVTALGLGVALNFVNIVGRYLFRAPIPWAEEVMLYLMLALVFLGAGSVSLVGRHIRMDMALHMLPARLRNFFDLLGEVIFVGVAATVIWLCVPVVMQFLDFDQRSEAAGVPVWIAHSLVPIGLAIMILANLVRIGERISGTVSR